MVLLTKATARDIISIVDVVDDDTAGMELGSNSLVMKEGGDAVDVKILKLTSEPLADVFVRHSQ